MNTDYLDANGGVGFTVCTEGDSDGDMFECNDNCPDVFNPGQEDSYPPGGNGCGDACEHEGNFDDDIDQDETDANLFLTDFGRTDCSDFESLQW